MDPPIYDDDDIEMALLCDQAIASGNIHPELQNEASVSSSSTIISPLQENEVIFAKSRSSDTELYPSVQVFFFLLGSIKIWLDFEMKVFPNRYISGSSSIDPTDKTQNFTNNILKIQCKTDKHLFLQFKNEATFLEWHDIVRQSLAQIVINNTFRISHIRKELRAIDLFDLISRCDLLVSNEFPDLMRVRELIAMKQQLSYWVSGWRSRIITSETMLITIENFMKRIMLERLDPLIIADKDFQQLVAIARAILSKREFDLFMELTSSCAGQRAYTVLSPLQSPATTYYASCRSGSGTPKCRVCQCDDLTNNTTGDGSIASACRCKVSRAKPVTYIVTTNERLKPTKFPHQAGLISEEIIGCVISDSSMRSRGQLHDALLSSAETSPARVIYERVTPPCDPMAALRPLLLPRSFPVDFSPRSAFSQEFIRSQSLIMSPIATPKIVEYYSSQVEELTMEETNVADAMLFEPLSAGSVDSPVDSPVESAPVESAPVESELVESELVESELVESEPVESAPVESAPIDSSIIEPATVESERVESTLVESAPVESEPVDSSIIEPAPVESERVESTLVESAPVESELVEPATVESERVESEPVESTLVESAPVESEPVDSSMIEPAPVESAPVEFERVKSAPVESTPVESEPIESAYVESALVELAPVESTLAESEPAKSELVEPEPVSINASLPAKVSDEQHAPLTNLPTDRPIIAEEVNSNFKKDEQKLKKQKLKQQKQLRQQEKFVDKENQPTNNITKSKQRSLSDNVLAPRTSTYPQFLPTQKIASIIRTMPEQLECDIVPVNLFANIRQHSIVPMVQPKEELLIISSFQSSVDQVTPVCTSPETSYAMLESALEPSIILAEEIPTPISTTETIFAAHKSNSIEAVHTYSMTSAGKLNGITKKSSRITRQRPFAMAVLLSVVVVVLSALYFLLPLPHGLIWRNQMAERLQVPLSLQKSQTQPSSPDILIQDLSEHSKTDIPHLTTDSSVHELITSSTSNSDREPLDIGVVVVQTLVVQSLFIQPFLLILALLSKLGTETSPQSTSSSSTVSGPTITNTMNTSVSPSFSVSDYLHSKSDSFSPISMMEAFEGEIPSMPPVPTTFKMQYSLDMRVRHHTEAAINSVGRATKFSAQLVVDILEHQHGAYA